MKKCKVFQRYLSIILAICLMMAMSIAAFASEGTVNAAVRDDRTGIVQVMVVYTDDEGEKYTVQTGSGFMINELNVVTCNHVTQLTDEDLEKAADYYGVEKAKLRKNLSIRISVMRDVSIGAKITTESREMDFAVLKLDEKLAGCKSLPIRSSDDLTQTEDCYALGFPTVTLFSQDGMKFTSEDVTITYGKVNKVSTIRGVEYVVNSASVASGNSGGPLVDANGSVIGIIQGVLSDGMSDNYSYAIASDALIETLDKLAVTYTKEGDESNKSTEGVTTEEPVDLAEKTDQSKLSAAIENANNTDLTQYTDESAKEVTDQLANAKSVQSDSSASQTTIDDATQKLNNALANLEEKKAAFPIWLIAVIAAAVIAIIVVIILMSRGNKKSAQSSRRQTPPTPPTPPVPPVPPTGGGYTPPVGGGVPPMYGGGAGTSVLGGANETTVLSGGNETTVLSADYGTLTRISTGEKITINKERFAIGRERGRVDYCISDNTAVGRTHAIIVNRGGNAYVIDQNSKNATYVNDQRAGANQEVKIKSGDKITFADEAFTYNAH